VEELRLEMIVPRSRLGEVVRALYASHSYEEPAFDLYPLDALAGRGAVGMGRVGRLGRPQPGTRLAERLARRVDLSTALVVGDLARRFTSVTAAAGSFGVRDFRDPDSLVITGEFKHHDALDLRRRGITAIQLGHYASERPVLDRLLIALRRGLPRLEPRIARADQPPMRPAGVR
jgi:putative NIF3 family GTP cyclohydrolase 1 type 2